MLGNSLDKLYGKQYLVIGDLMLDEYLYCEFVRISPEAPVPVYHILDRRYKLGGAGNVAANLVSLGGEVNIVGRIGKDEAGEKIASLLRQMGIGEECLVISPDYPTITKTRVMCGRNYQAVRLDHEKVSPPGREAGQRICSAARDALKKCDCAVISDYGKGMLTDDILGRVINCAGAGGVPVVVDPKGRDYRKYKGSTICTPNQNELAEASGREVRDDRDLNEAARTLLELSGIRNLAVTRGACGISLFREVRQWQREDFPAVKKDIVDVTGAGDTVAAVFAACLAGGVPLDEACIMANAAASVAVSRVGVAQPTLAEIAAEMNPGGKCFGRDVLASLLKRYRQKGRKIVFTNGCFDLLHSGHLKLLKQAREMGDILVVGLNSDASVRRIKGPLRPVNNQAVRAELLSGLSFVDLITVFDEDTPEETISLLAPDILVKGTDWDEKEVAGRGFVESMGGTVKLVDLVPGESTTGLIKKIVERYREVFLTTGVAK